MPPIEPTVVASEPALLVMSPVWAGSCAACSEPDRSVNAGCEMLGTPEVEIALTHSWVPAAMLSVPPSVVALGFGNRPAGRVPDEMFAAFVVSVEQLAATPDKSLHAGCVALGTPEVDIVLIHLWETDARLSMPPSVVAVGFGSWAAATEPDRLENAGCA